MAHLPNLPRRSPLETFSLVLAVGLSALGLATWAGWAVQLLPLLQPFQDAPASTVNEAFCFLIFGTCLFLIEYGLARYCWVAGIGALVALLSVAQQVLGLNLGIDELMASDFLTSHSSTPGRMALATSVCLGLAGLVLIWRALPDFHRGTRLVFEAITGSLLFATGLCPLLGYAAGLPALAHWGQSIPISPVGGLALLLLGTALLIDAWRVTHTTAIAPSWTPLPPTIIFAMLSVVLWIGLREREDLFLAGRTRDAVTNFAIQGSRQLELVRMQLSERVLSWKKDATDDTAIKDLSVLFESQLSERGCRVVGFLDSSGRTRGFHPVMGNEGLQGFDHRNDPSSPQEDRTTRSAALVQAAKDLKCITSGTLKSAGGKDSGFALYMPLVSEEAVAGYAFAEFDYHTFFESIRTGLGLAGDFRTQLSVDGITILSDDALESIAEAPHRIALSGDLEGRKFSLVLSPSDEYLRLNRRLLPELTLFAGLGISLLLGLSVRFACSARAGMLASQQANRQLQAENEERRRVEERLKTSDERLRLAMDSTSIGIFEWSVPSGHVYYSPGFWSMLGYEANRMAASIETIQALIFPEDLPQFRRRIEAQLNGAASFIDPEFRVRAHDGEWRWVYWRARSVVVSPEGLPSRIIGTLQDITSRKDAEEALRASQSATRKLSLVASRTDNLVVILTPDGRVEWVNESFTRTFEYPLTEICGKRPAEFLSGPDTDARGLGRVREALGNGHALSTDLVQYSKSGRKYHLSYDIQPVRNRASELENFIAVASDITARVETEQALRRAKSEADAASRSKSEFLASMSHEIRTPMNGVIGMTSLLLETALTQEQREYVGTIRNSGESLLAIINDILDFSKIESGKMEIERQPLDLASCIEDALELFALPASAKGLELVYHIDRGVPHAIIGDITRLRQVLVNLVNNAVKFTPTGSISVEVFPSSEDPADLGIPPGRMLLEFRVCDTGIGIPPDRIDRLFRVFSQVDSSTTRKYGGTGLGLAISERLCALMGGKIRVESTEGQGSAFIFTIQTEKAASQHEETVPPLPDILTRRQILVLEDHPVGQRRINSLLSAWGAKTMIAATPEELLKLYNASTPPCLLVLDHELTSKSGCLGSLAEIQAPRLFMLPFGSPPPEVPEDDHPRAFLSKPVRATNLYQTITNIFAIVDAGPNAAPIPKEPVLADQIPLKVLLVEDNPVNQKVALRFLDRLGYSADAAANGLEALAAMEKGRYQLVLMDLQMPEMDGLEASRQIRQRFPASEQPKIIALTANALRGDRELCIEAGMDDYVTKPVKMQEIAEAIRRQFAQQGAKPSTSP